MKCILYLFIAALLGVAAVLAQSNATHGNGFPGLAVFANALAKPHQYKYKPDQYKRQQTPGASFTDEPTATDAEPSETDVDDSTATQDDDAESTEAEGPTATESDGAAETTSDDDSPSETESSGATATDDDSEEPTATDDSGNDDDDDDDSTATDNSDGDKTSTASESSKTGGASNKGSDNGQTGLVAVDARDGTESSKKTPPDVTTPDQHNAESKANLPNVAISGDDAKEVVVMEAVMFDYFVTNDPAPADRGQIKLSSNVSQCKVGIEKRSTWDKRALGEKFSRDLREDCKYVTSLEFDIYFNYVRGTIDSERPNNLEDRVETSVGLLNDVYGPLGINFTYKAYQQWAPPESGSNKDWSKVTQFEERLEQWQTDTHTGNEMTLNVWLVNDLRSDGGDKELNGYASFPWDKKGSLDGIVLQEDRINKDTIPTFIHEIGHWLGLRHTFREQVDKVDQDCGVADGLIDSSVTTGLVDNMFECSQTTCSSSTSKDIVNYMSYSQCRGKVPEDGFTTDQKSAIYSRVLKYRRGYRDGECTAQYSDSADAKKMMKRSTMQDLVDGDCPNIAAGVQDLQSQPTSTNSGGKLGQSLCCILAGMAGSLFIMM